jgi:hypothetical protein
MVAILIKDKEECWSEFWNLLLMSIRCIKKPYFQIERDTIEEGSPLVWRERAYCYELYHQIRCHLPYDYPYKLHGEIDKKGHQEVNKFFKEEYLFTWDDSEYECIKDYLIERYSDVDWLRSTVFRKTSDICIEASEGRKSISLNLKGKRVSVKRNKKEILSFKAKNENSKTKIYKSSKIPNPDFVLHIPRSEDNLAVIEIKVGEMDRLNRENCENDLSKLEIFIDKIKYKHGVFLVFGGSFDHVKEIIEKCKTKERCKLIKENKLNIIYHEKAEEFPYCITVASCNGQDKLVIQKCKFCEILLRISPNM